MLAASAMLSRLLAQEQRQSFADVIINLLELARRVTHLKVGALILSRMRYIARRDGQRCKKRRPRYFQDSSLRQWNPRKSKPWRPSPT